MSNVPSFQSEAPPAAPALRRPLWPTLLAWLVVLGAVGTRVALPYLAPEQEPGQQEGMQDVLLRMQARYVVGAANSFGHRHDLLRQVEGFNAGSLPERLRFAILAGELEGPKEASKCLDQTRAALSKKEIRPQPGREEIALLDVLDRLYSDYTQGRLNAPSVSPQQRQQLVRRLGWFGELALAPAGANAEQRENALSQAYRTFWMMFGGVLGGLGFAFLGLMLLVGFLILAGIGYFRSALSAGISHGGIYAETFALWMLFFFGASFAALVVGIPEEQRLWWEGGIMLLSLVVLGWPVLRGIPWAQVRQDVGLTFGRRPLLEPAAGIGCYLMSLPLLGLALLVILLVMIIQQSLQGGEAGPNNPLTRAAHPIVRELAQGDWGTRLFLLVLAGVVAPLVEETMFRGVLYRHLREATRRLGTVGSFLVSAGVVSFLFAVIHPQGLIAVPLLMALALGFALAREWRGTLVPGMVGHSLNNALVFLFLILALGD
jgi:membrane protease YdiL (CAAX protease family)